MQYTIEDEITVETEVVVPETVTATTDIVMPIATIEKDPNTIIISTPTIEEIKSSSITVSCEYSSDVDYYGGISCSEYEAQEDASLVNKPNSLQKTITGLTRDTDYYIKGVGLPILGNITYSDIIKIHTLSSPIPKEYQLVEYLQSNGTQYINTKVQPELNLGFDIKYQYINTNNSETVVMGASTSQYYAQGKNIAVGRYINTQYIYLSSLQNAFTFDGYSNIYDMKYNLTGYDYSYTCNTRSGVITSIDFPTYEIFLFGRNLNNSLGTTSPFYGKIFECHFYLKGDVIKSFYPVYRISDGVAGMYDTVDNVFYTNQGTGDFIVGPDKEWEE